MSMMNCPECGHQVSTEALACPNCGHPFAAQPNPVVTPRVIVAEPERSEFPKWVIVPVVLVTAILVFVLFAMLKGSDEEDSTSRVNVNLASDRTSANTRDSRSNPPPNQVDVPSSSTTVVTPPPTSSAPQTIPPVSQTEIVSAPPPSKGSVLVEAKIQIGNGSIQSVKNEKFYLLDEDLESILSDANLEPIEGQTLSNSFGMAVMYPDRYRDFQRDALNAIKKHIKYNATTDGSGKASMKDVEPDSYYLFGITKDRNGFAVWSSPVTIIGGENKLNLSPARLTEVSE